MTHPACRSCGAALTQTLVDLGLSPLANSYVPPERAGTACPRYPLHAWVCNDCYLVQVEDAVPADEIFNADYAYFSSYSDSWLAHAKAYVEKMVDRLDLGPDDLVIEIASNDGYLLQYFVEKGIPVLGIEPSGSVAAAAEEKGVRTLVDYFGEALARKVAETEKPPSLIASANVLAHVPDINDFVTGIATLLTGDAVYTVEFPHLLNLINEVQFDTIYHEHYSYLSLLAVEKVFAKAGLRVFDVEELPTHGGSLRVFACLEDASHPEGPGLAKVRADEAAARFDQPEGYMNFTTQVEALRDGLLAFLRATKARGDTVAAYGAAAKGNTLLNYAGIGPDLISYCVDRNPAKQNTLLPGSHIPVHGVEALREAPPDYVLILPWNIRDEVTDQLSDLKAHGTRFVTAVPEVRIS
ncbi:class I SAM-dependent methyltransferase [uncultured Ruegeria sp.]|uniref:class I SAM-dependent methyltransferase n=1 Tax=uncultured Ruegeria sp. TaxID=259304 RepID=UPI0026109CB8|nr:class I SAM-dependent methyltransferase [uncultured Ruegeria sp.]